MKQVRSTTASERTRGAAPIRPPVPSRRALLRGNLARRIGKGIEQLAKRCVASALDVVLPVPASETLDVLHGVKRVLLVRPNFRIGNMLMTAPLVPALGARFPGANIEVLAADTTAPLLEHLPLDAVHVVSRRFVVRPWEFVRLFRALRRRRFDVAVDGGMGSFSGPLYARLAGARHRIGWSGAGDRFLTVRLAPARGEHAYDSAPAFARQLGQWCADHPIYQVSAREAVAAEAYLAEAGVRRDGDVLPFVALFVGGHLAKRWPAECWMRLAAQLARSSVRYLVFVGPEEVDLGLRLEASGHPILAPRPLRTCAALLARAAAVVTPDTGVLHLAVALCRPTIAILQQERSLRFRPRGAGDVTLMRPTVEDVVRALVGHVTWPAVADAQAVPIKPAATRDTMPPASPPPTTV